MDVVRQGWRNLDEVELVEDTWRKKLIEAKALPYRPDDSEFHVLHNIWYLYQKRKLIKVY